MGLDDEQRAALDRHIESCVALYDLGFSVVSLVEANPDGFMTEGAGHALIHPAAGEVPEGTFLRLLGEVTELRTRIYSGPKRDGAPAGNGSR